MKKSFLFLTGMLYLLLLVNPVLALNKTIGVALGYNNGPGLIVESQLTNIARDFPFRIRLGFGYTRTTDPGNALDARHIFINDNSNGSPEKAGWMFDFRGDLLYPVKWLGFKQAFAYGGVRYNMFTGNFNFINGNEDFDVTTDEWGLGGGLMNSYAISKSLDLVLDGGLDYYLPGVIYAHGTSYSPDGEHVEARNDYEYKDADEAINQPKINLRLTIGLSYRF